MNRKHITRRVVSLLLSLFMVASLCIPTTLGTSVAVAAETNSAGITSYTPIGDSVSTGYGPLEMDWSFPTYYFKTGEGAYPRLLKDELGIDEENYHPLTSIQLGCADTYYILGGEFETDEETEAYFTKANGYHDAQYMKLVDELHNGKGADYIKNSDLITLAIGNIDLAIYPRRDAVKEDGSLDTAKLKANMAVGMADFKKYYPMVLNRIHEINPNAKVLVMSQYDPYKRIKRTTSLNLGLALLGLSGLFDTVTESNSFLRTYLNNNKSLGTYVDITGTGDYVDEVDTTVSSQETLISTVGSHENHPGALGHQYIREQLMKALNVSHAPKKVGTQTDKHYVAFSSDVHVKDGEASLKRLSNWVKVVSENLGGITFENMGFTGDLGSASAESWSASRTRTSTYWNKVARLMDTVQYSPYIGNGVFTFGNHEYSPGNYQNIPSTRNNQAPYTGLKRMTEGVKTNDYSMYCFGAAQYDQKFLDEDIAKLDDYLKTCDPSKPVFVLSHFPIHTNASRVSGNAAALVNVLNKYSNVVFLWGHNHTDSDPHYNKVYTGSIDGTPINFIYASAGCMSDEEYSTGSKNTTSKGLVATMDGDNTIQMTYYDKNGNVVKDYTVDVLTGEEIDGLEANYSADYAFVKANNLVAGETYVIATGDQAMNTKTHAGYTTINNNITYKYSGLQANTVKVVDNKLTKGVTEDNLFEAVANGSGIALKSVTKGTYLKGSYTTGTTSVTGGASISLGTPAEAWTYASEKLTNTNTNKPLNFETPGDVSGTQQSGTLDVFTLRTSAKDTITIYKRVQVSGDVIYPVADSVAAGKTYVIASTDSVNETGYALNAQDSEGYVTKNGNNTYKYSGLKADDATIFINGVANKLAAENYWVAEAVDGGFAFKNVATGEYLNASYSTTVSGYAGVGTFSTSATPEAWTFSGGSFKHVGSGKVLQYQSSGDIDGTKQSGVTDFYTVRSSAKESVYAYAVSDALVKEALAADISSQKNITEASVSISGGNVVYDFNGDYVIANANDYALTTKTGIGYNDSTSNYRYDGLKPAKITVKNGKVTYGVTEEGIFNITPAENGEGYYIRSLNGLYLNGVYNIAIGGAENAGTRVYLSTTKEVWTLTADGKLQEDSGKQLSYQTNGGETQVFTLRSSGNAIRFYKVEGSGTTVCEHTTVVVSNNNGTHSEKCTKCDLVLSTTACVPQTIAEGKPASCTESGLTASEKCSVCGYVIQTQTVIPATGHQLTKHAAVAATFFAAGNIEHSTCDNCGKYYTADGKTELTAEAVIIKQLSGSAAIVNGDGYALTTATAVGYNDVNSNYRYDGLKPVKVTVTDGKVTAGATEECIWNIVPADGGFYIVSADGRYLNGVYERVTGGAENSGVRVYLSTTKEVWTMVDGKLQEDSGKQLSYETNQGATAVYTLRSSGNTINIYPVENVEEPGCEHTTVVVSNNNGTHSEKCTKCDTIVSTENCNQNTKVAGTPASCTATGLTDGAKCSVCGAVTKAQTTIAMTAHSLTNHAAVAATETTDGNVEYNTCNVCGKYFAADGKTEITAADVVIPATGHVHSLVKTDAVAATCNAAGTEAYWTCSKCNKLYSDQNGVKEISKPVATALNPSNHVGGTEIRNAKAANCTEAGYTGDTYCKGCNTKIASGSVLPAAGHKLTKHAAVAATETTDGNVEYNTCNVCGKYFAADGKTEITAADVVISATGHTHVLVMESAVAATCNATGTEAYWTCSKCNKMYSDKNGVNEITKPVVTAKDPSNHAGGTEIRDAKEASCTENGSTGDTYCLGCNTKIANGSVIPAAGHKLTKHEAVAATETTDGNVEYNTCDVCGKYFAADGKTEVAATAVVIPAVAHTHVLVEHAAVAGSCIAEGTDQYWECSKCHKLYSDNAGSTEISAPVKNVKDPANHTGEVVVKDDKAVSCTEDGYTGDTYCKDCDKLLTAGNAIPAKGHDYNDGKVTKTATCTTEGELTYTCKECAATKNVAIPVAGHQLIKHVALAPTETTAGYVEHYTCSVCKKYFTDEAATVETSADAVKLPAVGHTHVLKKVSGKTATCKETGYKAYYACTGCLKIFSDAEGKTEIATPVVIPAKAHQYNAGTVTKAPTCSKKGVKTYTCTVCQTTKTESIDALGHDYSKTVIVPATTSASGSYSIVCSVCGDIAAYKKINKISSMKLKYTSCVYSGNYKKPSVTIKDSAGNTIDASNYKVTYSKNKLVGTATVKVTFNGVRYKGTMSKTFKICPKKTSIVSMTARSKGFDLKWTKVSPQCDGYQIEYSTSKNFTTSKKTSVKGYTVTTKTFSRLLSNKRYYVRIRAFKDVNGKRYYSKRCAVKYVTTK